MSSNIPGAFPTTPERARSFHSKTPTVADFHFTPLSNNGPLYPNIDGYNTDLNKECQRLGYSNKLSANVLQELDKRAATKISSTSYAAKKNALSPRSSRYNASHRSRFTKMESISSHYAAKKALNERQEIEVEKENIPLYGPSSKRNNLSMLSSATKRRKTELGSREVNSSLPPTQKFTNLSSILQGTRSTQDRARGFQMQESQSHIPHLPSKTSLRLPTTLHTLKTSTSTMSLKKKSSVSSISGPTSTPTFSSLTTAKKLPRSTTLGNLTKPTASSISKSTSTRTLTGRDSKESLSGIPRSKSIYNTKLNPTAKPGWR